MNTQPNRFIHKWAGHIMKKINIGFCIPDMIVGGVESVFILTLEELIKNPQYKIFVFMQSELNEAFYKDWFAKHHEITLRTIYPMLPFFERLKRYTRIFPLENIRKIIFGIYKRYKRMRFAFGNIDIFIDYKHASFFKELRFVRKPKITWCHGSVDFFQESKLITRLNIYNRMVVLTQEFADEFKAIYPNYADKIMCIYNPINTADIIAKATKAPRFNERYFCAVARLGCPKDLRTVIYAFNDFYSRENMPDIKLLLVGDGPYREALEKQAQKTVAAKNVVFTGTITNPFGIMQDAMAHILSSNSEGFGMVLIEAMALDTLNVSSNHRHGPAEILEEGKAGLLFECGDIISLSNIMSDIYHGRINTNEMIKRAHESLSRFSVNTIIPQITNLINSHL